MEADVLVVGGGVAGVAACLAAREAGAQRVVCVHRGHGGTAHHPGGFGRSQVPGDDPHHPLADAADVGSAVAGLLAALQAGGLRYETRSGPALGPSGAAVPVGWAPPVVADVAALRGRPLVLAGLEGDPSFDPAWVLDRLAAHDPDGWGAARPVRVPHPIEPVAAEPGWLRIALGLEEAAVRDRWMAAVAPQLEGAEVVVLPPMLGLDHVEEVRAALAEGWEVAVHEALAEAPSVPGRRLCRALGRVLAAEGVEVVAGRVVAVDERSVVLDGTVTAAVSADAVVLATGRHPEGLHDHDEEPLYGCPYTFRGRPVRELRPEDRLQSVLTADHPGLLAGLAVDGSGRPLGDSGETVAPWLFAAGGLLGGWDPADGGELEVAAWSGWRAGRNAARVAAGMEVATT